MAISELFEDPPRAWGMRGDPYLWAALARRLGDAAMPASVDDLLTSIIGEFHALTGGSITSEREIFVEEFAFGGMSSGYVCPSFWCTTALPLLAERFRCVKAGVLSVRHCEQCGETMAVDCFRKGSRYCVWCVYESKEKRANARYSDKAKGAASRLKIDREAFVRWYSGESDSCAYCGLTYRELRELRLRRRGGYSVAWDIDRKDSARHYEEGNLALSCFVCNMSKCDMLSADEAMIVGEAIRRVWDGKLDLVRRERNHRAAVVSELITSIGLGLHGGSGNGGRA